MKKTGKSMLGVTAVVGGVAAAATAVCLVSRQITKKLMQIALDRKQPDMPEKVKKSMYGKTTVDVDELMEENQESIERLKNSPSESVEIAAFDGTVLKGHLVRSDREERIIIAMHGWRSSWLNDFSMIAPFWKESGCSVLYVEQRGQNESGGDYMGFGLLERYDCLSWAEWVDRTINAEAKKPIYLCGISMGATGVLMASNLDLPERVRGIVADCGFTSPDAIWEQVVKHNFHLQYSARRPLVEKICQEKIHMGAGEMSTTDALKQAKVPVLFIHGSGDHFVPIEMTYQNYQACTAPKRLLVVPGAEHGLSYCVDRDSYQKTFLAFCRDFDASV